MDNISTSTVTKTDISVGSRIGTGVVLGLGIALLAGYLAAGGLILSRGQRSSTYPTAPVLSGSWMAWVQVTEVPGNFLGDIYVKNTTTGETRRVTPQSTAAPQLPITLDGGRVAWSDVRVGQDVWDIYQYSILTGQTTRLTNDGYSVLPEISGNNMVWTDCAQNDNCDIMMMNLVTLQQTTIVSGQNEQVYADISGGTVAWVDQSEGGGVYTMSIDTMQPRRIEGSGLSARYPRTDGNTVVWGQRPEDDYSQEPEIYLYTISTQNLVRVTNDALRQWNPDVQNGLVVWSGESNGSYDIFSYAIGTGLTSQITNDSVLEADPRLARPWVVWMEVNGAGPFIRLFRIDPLPGASPSILKETTLPASAQE